MSCLRRPIAAAVLVSLALGLTLAWAGTSAAVDVPTLQERLENDLKARRPSEFAFIALVVDLVEKDVLPLRIVESSFLWARKQPKGKRPFQYFEFALREQARRLGIELPKTVGSSS